MIERPLGHGSFSITYIAWDKKSERKVAVKEYFPEDVSTRAQDQKTVSVFEFGEEYSQDFENGLEIFLTETRTLSRFLGYPNIVTIMNSFTENGTAYLVMEYVEGVSLQTLLKHKEGGRLPLAEALNYILPVADALSLVHAAGLWHLNICPDSMYVTKDNQTELLDFGASRKAIGTVARSKDTLMIPGEKPGYDPIEQFATGMKGPWTDVYMLAATLYKLLSGKIPPKSIDLLLQAEELETFGSLGIEAPADLEAVLSRALAVEPQKRFQNMEEFKKELSRALF